MAQYDRMAVLNAIYDTGIVPVFYNADPETTIHIVEACARPTVQGSLIGILGGGDMYRVHALPFRDSTQQPAPPA